MWERAIAAWRQVWPVEYGDLLDLGPALPDDGVSGRYAGSDGEAFRGARRYVPMAAG